MPTPTMAKMMVSSTAGCVRWPRADKQDAERDAERRGEQPGTEAAKSGGEQAPPG